MHRVEGQKNRQCVHGKTEHTHTHRQTDRQTDRQTHTEEMGRGNLVSARTYSHTERVGASASERAHKLSTHAHANTRTHTQIDR